MKQSQNKTFLPTKINDSITYTIFFFLIKIMSFSPFFLFFFRHVLYRAQFFRLHRLVTGTVKITDHLPCTCLQTDCQCLCTLYNSQPSLSEDFRQWIIIRKAYILKWGCTTTTGSKTRHIHSNLNHNIIIWSIFCVIFVFQYVIGVKKINLRL